MFRQFMLTLAATSVATLVALANPGQPTGDFSVLHRYVLGGEGGWDYLTADPEAHRLYIARSNRVMVMDTASGALAGEVKNTPGVHGVALVPQRGRGFTSNGGDGSLSVFDLKTLAEVNRVKVGPRPDAIFFDPGSGRVFACHAGGELTAVDAEAEKVVGTVQLGGKLEGIVSDERGRLFVNVEDKNEVVVVDAKELKVLGRWPLAPGKEPTGLAIDRAKGRLFASCHSGQMVVLDATTGQVLATPAIGKGTDGCAFDPGTGLAYSSNGDGTLTVVREARGGGYEVAETVATLAGARTLALDPRTHHLFLVTAKPRAGQRRSYEPNSFVVLEVGQP